MNIKKITTILFLVTILLFSIANYINAAEGQSMQLSLKVDNKNYKIGDEILVDVYIDNIKGFSGINTFIAKKNYNSECLEYIETVPEENWKVEGDAEKVLLRKMEGEDLSKGKLCTLKFKVLKNENTTMQLTEVDACSGEGDVYFEDKNVNEPSIEINFSETSTNSNNQKSYAGIILIAVGLVGLIGVGAHYILNRNKQ